MAETIQVLGHERSGVDTRELKKLTKDFRDWKPDKALHKMLRTAGQLIADDAKEIVEGISKSTVETIKVKVTKTRVSVVAGGAGHAISGLEELGNRGGGKSQSANRTGRFRHPVFGDRSNWVDQKRESYLLPALERNEKKIEVLEGRAVAEAFRERDFPVEDF
jgi:hypothetical protein